MTRLAQTLGLTEFQTEIVSTVRQFVDKEVIPTAQELEHADTYPQAIVDAMREIGIAGAQVHRGDSQRREPRHIGPAVLRAEASARGRHERRGRRVPQPRQGAGRGIGDLQPDPAVGQVGAEHLGAHAGGARGPGAAAASRLQTGRATRSADEDGPSGRRVQFSRRAIR